MDKDMTFRIAATGHRPDKLWGWDLSDRNYVILQSTLAKFIRNALWDMHREGTLKIISGMALGVDQMWARAALYLRDVKNQDRIKLVAACPCQGHESQWPEESQKTFREIIEKADEVLHVHDGPYPGPQCMQERNKWMVDHCDMLVAVWDGSTGGTANCLGYYERNHKSKPAIWINPKNWTMRYRGPVHQMRCLGSLYLPEHLRGVVTE